MRLQRGQVSRDLANHFQLKHMANAETRLVRYNLLHPGHPRQAAFAVVPSDRLIVPSLPVTPGPGLAVPVSGGQ